MTNYRTIKTVVEMPSFPNVKGRERIHEEKTLMNMVDANLEVNSVVADFGCGTSYYTRSNVIGIDLDKKLLKRADLAHKVLAHYNFAPFKEKSFDGIVMCHSLEHINTPWKTLTEVHRVLKKNGVLGVSVPNLRGFFQLWNIIIRGIVQPCIGSDHLTAFTPKVLKQFFRECGFKPIKESGDIVYFPGMKRLRLMRLGFWLAKHFPTWANVYILVGGKK